MSTIHNFIQEQEAGFTNQIPLEDGWWWNFKEHVRRSFLYKNSQFERNNDDREKRPFKNIVRPILNIHYRTEGFDVKDIELYVDNPDKYHLSFLVKKFYDKWALENEIDTFIDELVESYVDYGGVLIKNVKGVRPEVVDLRTVAFCDQTDLLGGPFSIKHYFSVPQLEEMKGQGWDADAIDTLVIKSEKNKAQDKEDGNTATPGKYIEIYETHNVTDMDFDLRSTDADAKMFITSFTTDEQGNKQGITLFEKEEDVDKFFKFLKRDPIQGRALGFGAIEELFEAQAWTNFAEINITGMLHHASKVFYKTTDPNFKTQNLTNIDNGEVLQLKGEGDVAQIDNTPRNLNAFTNFVVEMHEHAGEIGAASDLFLGQQPSSGTPFKSVEAQLVEGKSLHLWRQGRIAVFVDEIHRDWIIPSLGKKIRGGDKFLSELSADEMITVSESVARNEANKKAKEAILKGEMVTRERLEQIKLLVKETFLRAGNKRFLEILKDEVSGDELNVTTNIVGKQKNLALLTDKMVNVLRQFLATPEMRQDPEMVRLLNTILESSGLSPITFGPSLSPIQPQGGGSTEPLKDLAQSNEPK